MSFRDCFDGIGSMTLDHVIVGSTPTLGALSRGKTFSNERLVREAVKTSKSMREALEKLGLRAAGGNYKALRQACKIYGLQVPYADPKTQTRIANQRNTFPLETVLRPNSNYRRGLLKKRLLKEKLLEEKCAECGLGSHWNNKKLVLQLDHINGVYNDNRLENLRLLCPNCHSQTNNYAGKHVH